MEAMKTPAGIGGRRRWAAALLLLLLASALVAGAAASAQAAQLLSLGADPVQAADTGSEEVYYGRFDRDYANDYFTGYKAILVSSNEEDRDAYAGELAYCINLGRILEGSPSAYGEYMLLPESEARQKAAATGSENYYAFANLPLFADAVFQTEPKRARRLAGNRTVMSGEETLRRIEAVKRVLWEGYPNGLTEDSALNYEVTQAAVWYAANGCSNPAYAPSTSEKEVLYERLCAAADDESLEVPDSFQMDFFVWNGMGADSDGLYRNLLKSADSKDNYQNLVRARLVGEDEGSDDSAPGSLKVSKSVANDSLPAEEQDREFPFTVTFGEDVGGVTASFNGVGVELQSSGATSLMVLRPLYSAVAEAVQAAGQIASGASIETQLEIDNIASNSEYPYDEVRVDFYKIASFSNGELNLDYPFVFTQAQSDALSGGDAATQDYKTLFADGPTAQTAYAALADAGVQPSRTIVFTPSDKVGEPGTVIASLEPGLYIAGGEAVGPTDNPKVYPVAFCVTGLPSVQPTVIAAFPEGHEPGSQIAGPIAKNGNTFSFMLGDGDYVDFANIPADVSYTVSEGVLPEGWNLMSSTNAEGVVQGGTMTESVWVNEYVLDTPNQSQTGSLVISKSASNASLPAEEQDREFPFTVAFDGYGTDSWFEDNYHVVLITDKDAPVGWRLADIRSALEAGGMQVDIAHEGVFVEAAAGGMDLELQQAILDLAEDHPGRVIAVVSVEYEECFEIYTETLLNGDPTYAGLLTGVALGIPTYHLSEAWLPDALNMSSLWDDGTWSSQPGEIADAYYGEFVGGERPREVFSEGYKAIASGNVRNFEHRAGTVTFTLKVGESISLDGLPAGVSYTVTEGLLPSGWSLHSSTNVQGLIEGGQQVESVWVNEYVGTEEVDATTVQVLAEKNLVGRDLEPREFVFELVRKEQAGSLPSTGGGSVAPGAEFEIYEVGMYEDDHVVLDEPYASAAEANGFGSVGNGTLSWSLSVADCLGRYASSEGIRGSQVRADADGYIRWPVSQANRVYLYVQISESPDYPDIRTNSGLVVVDESVFPIDEWVIQPRDSGIDSFIVEEVVAEVSNAQSGVVDFGVLSLSQLSIDSPGEYTFYMREVEGDIEGVTYDTAERRVVVTVVEEAGGLVVQSVTYPDGVVFENYYTNPVKLLLPVTGGVGRTTVALLGICLLLARAAIVLHNKRNNGLQYME